MRKLVVGDIHGGHRALMQCIDRSGFNPEEDMLISLGDIADGWPDVKECFTYLLSLKHKQFVIGNHDVWLSDWLQGEYAPKIWVSQGGLASIESYGMGPVPQAHIDFLRDAPFYYVDENKNLFVHGGIDASLDLHEQKRDFCIWDRDLLDDAVRCGYVPQTILDTYNHVFVGHTTTTSYHTETPIFVENMIALDTGGGWEGKLTIMDVDTHEYWQSDPVCSLYPNVKGRGNKY